MSLISSSIPNLINGVSQQPDTIRMVTQGELQINGVSSVVDGLSKRPASQHIKQISATSLPDCLAHFIVRDQNERYVVAITSTSIRVWDLEGNEKTVNAPNGWSYLAGVTEPSKQLKALTVADYTFILNTTKTISMDPAVSPGSPNEGLVFIRAINYDVVYTINLPGYGSVSYTTPSSGSISALTAAASLASSLDALANVTATAYGPVVWFSTTGAYTLSADSSRGQDYITGIPGKIQQFGNLPTKAKDGFIVEVTGDNSSSFDNYYVKFSSGGSGNDGTWVETLKPGITYKFNPDTMPYVLIREADGTFTFKRNTWTDRLVGDLESNPDPTFVGRKINFLFFHRNRLGFLSDENVVMSEASEYFNFFKTTATTVVDSDPIDISAAHTKVSILESAIGIKSMLLLFSGQTQFVLDTGDADILSAETASIRVLSEYQSIQEVPPVAAGEVVFFIVERGEYAGVREYYLQLDTANSGSADITGHVPKYIPLDIRQMVVNSVENYLILLSEAERYSMFVYKYYWSGDEKVQSSWSKWEFCSDTELLGIGFIDNYLYVLANFGDSASISKIPVDASHRDIATSIEYKLDRKVDETSIVSSSYDPDTDLTALELPYVPCRLPQVIVREDSGGLKEGTVLPVYASVEDANGAPVVPDTPTSAVWAYRQRITVVSKTVAEPGHPRFGLPLMHPTTVFPAIVPIPLDTLTYYESSTFGSNISPVVFPSAPGVCGIDTSAAESAGYVVTSVSPTRTRIERPVNTYGPSISPADSFSTYSFQTGTVIDGVRQPDFTIYKALVSYSTTSTEYDLIEVQFADIDSPPIPTATEPWVLIGYCYGGSSEPPPPPGPTPLTEVIYVRGDATSLKLFVGLPYDFIYRFSKFYLRNSQNNEPITDGKLQLRKATVTYEDTGYFTMRVYLDGRETSEYVFNGSVLGISELGSVNILSGTFDVPILSNNETGIVELRNDSHLPCKFVKADWEGLYHRRSRRS